MVGNKNFKRDIQSCRWIIRILSRHFMNRLISILTRILITYWLQSIKAVFKPVRSTVPSEALWIVIFLKTRNGRKCPPFSHPSVVRFFTCGITSPTGSASHTLLTNFAPAWFWCPSTNIWSGSTSTRTKTGSVSSGAMKLVGTDRIWFFWRTASFQWIPTTLKETHILQPRSHSISFWREKIIRCCSLILTEICNNNFQRLQMLGCSCETCKFQRNEEYRPIYSNEIFDPAQLPMWSPLRVCLKNNSSIETQRLSSSIVLLQFYRWSAEQLSERPFLRWREIRYTAVTKIF